MSEKMVRFQMVMESGTHYDLKQYADRIDDSMAQIVRRAIRRELERCHVDAMTQAKEQEAAK